MNDERPDYYQWLLDDHFEMLSDAERRELRQACNADPELERRYRRALALLEPLDCWSAPTPPSSLADRVLARLPRTNQETHSAAYPKLTTGADGDFRRRFPLAMRDMIGLAAAMVLVGLMLFPGLAKARSETRRIACANHLGVIGRAVSAYAGDYQGRLPQAKSIPGGRWLRVSDRGGPYVPNSRSPYLLLRFQYVPEAKPFICPSCCDAQVMNVQNAHALADFADPRNCSYDSLNTSGPTPQAEAAPRQAYMADANPLFAGGRFNPVDPQSPSRNHIKLGKQNVLCLDGAVEWCSNPTVARSRDNIWQVRAIRVYNGREAQQVAADTFLVP